MRKLIVSDTLRYSRDMYSSHISDSAVSQPPRFRQFSSEISSAVAAAGPSSAPPAPGLAMAPAVSPKDLNFGIELSSNNELNSVPDVLTH